MIQIGVVRLCYDAIYKLTAQFTATCNQALVAGRNHDKGYSPNMFGKGFADLFVPTHLLGLSSFEDTTHLYITIMPMYCKKIFTDTYILLVNRVEVALAK